MFSHCSVILVVLTALCGGLGQAVAGRDFFSDRFGRRPVRPFRASFGPRNYTLCTYSDVAQAKCLRAVQEAEDNVLQLPLKCQQLETLEACVQAVRRQQTVDMVALTTLDYREARAAGLEPIVYERDNNDSLFLAVAPRSISLVAVMEAPLALDLHDHRARHAAGFFNLKRGHSICPLQAGAEGGDRIRIVDSAQYTPADDELLICPDRSFAEATPANYERCNIEATLQRAVFASRRVHRRPIAVLEIKRIFDTIVEHFGGADDDGSFNFFAPFEGSDDVIFKSTTIAFDLQPTYRNGISEKLFSDVHCEDVDPELE